MSGKRSRDKGLRRERELAKIVGGRRIPLSGAQDGFGGDVEVVEFDSDMLDEARQIIAIYHDSLQLPIECFAGTNSDYEMRDRCARWLDKLANRVVYEVKSRRNGWVTLYRLLRELQTRCPDHDEHRLALKADNEPWIKVSFLTRGDGGGR